VRRWNGRTWQASGKNAGEKKPCRGKVFLIATEGN
jgi:hypothetical protein